MTKKIGILTSGGDAPGLNPVIAGYTKTAIKNGYKVIGFLDGWKGLIEGQYENLTLERIKEITQEGFNLVLFSGLYQPHGHLTSSILC